MTDLLTVSEVAQILRVDDTTVRRWIKQGALEAIALPCVNVRQSYRVRHTTIDTLLEFGRLPADETLPLSGIGDQESLNGASSREGGGI